jgi:hypothetical protein
MSSAPGRAGDRGSHPALQLEGGARSTLGWRCVPIFLTVGQDGYLFASTYYESGQIDTGIQLVGLTSINQFDAYQIISTIPVLGAADERQRGEWTRACGSQGHGQEIEVGQQRRSGEWSRS